MSLRLPILTSVAGMALCACSTPREAPSPNFAAVLADPSRPGSDVARDADRKPAELMAFAGIRPGLKIVELAPGGGYFSVTYQRGRAGR